jgi:iron complex transport system substrate-binding protein
MPGCGQPNVPQTATTLTVTDQLGRTVTVPQPITRISALHHVGGKIVYALGRQDLLVDQALYGIESDLMTKIDPKFAAMPKLLKGHSINTEELVALKPQIVFAYASFDKSEMEPIENAGIKVIGIKAETLEDSFEAVKLVAQVLGCPEKAQAYLADCQKLLDLVQERVAPIPAQERLKVMFAGPKSIYTVATGEMLQRILIERAGGLFVSQGLKGFWADVSPEQVVAWNPDVIFLGSTLDTYGLDEIFNNSQFKTVKAVQTKKIYTFPSNVGWWDFPAPHCVLGVLWSAKTLYPDRFRDVDMLQIADDFYSKYLGHSFTELGGKLQ